MELLKAKEKEREVKEKAMAEARRRRVMTSEEKIRRLKEMEDDGSRNQVHVVAPHSPLHSALPLQPPGITDSYIYFVIS